MTWGTDQLQSLPPSSFWSLFIRSYKNVGATGRQLSHNSKASARVLDGIRGRLPDDSINICQFFQLCTLKPVL